MKKNNLWLIGKSNMAYSYAEVLNELGVEFSLISREECKIDNPISKISTKRLFGGIDLILESNKAPDTAIVAVNVQALYKVASKLINVGCKYILLEKPGALYKRELEDLSNLCEISNCKIYIAYNRRFFSSVKLLRKLVKKEGGIQTINFEFTEWGKDIMSCNHPKEVLERWLLANSTHVLDLAFHLAGLPKDGSYKFFKKGSLDWHSSSQFCGSGVTENKILFSYNANWASAGRWGLEVLTSKNKYILSPMEKLQRMTLNSIKIDNLKLDDSNDVKYKPGIFDQCIAFLNNDRKYLCDINSHLKAWKIFEAIGGYDE